MTAVLALAGEVFTDATVIYGTTRWALASGVTL
jgi:hypothetical protein